MALTRTLDLTPGSVLEVETTDGMLTVRATAPAAEPYVSSATRVTQALGNATETQLTSALANRFRWVASNPTLGVSLLVKRR